MKKSKIYKNKIFLDKNESLDSDQISTMAWSVTEGYQSNIYGKVLISSGSDTIVFESVFYKDESKEIEGLKSITTLIDQLQKFKDKLLEEIEKMKE